MQNNGDLIFEFQNRTQVLKHDLPKNLLYYLKKKLSKDAQYFGGELKVIFHNVKTKEKEIKVDKYSEMLRNN